MKRRSFFGAVAAFFFPFKIKAETEKPKVFRGLLGTCEICRKFVLCRKTLRPIEECRCDHCGKVGQVQVQHLILPGGKSKCPFEGSPGSNKN